MSERKNKLKWKMYDDNYELKKVNQMLAFYKNDKLDIAFNPIYIINITVVDESKFIIEFSCDNKQLNIRVFTVNSSANSDAFKIAEGILQIL